MLYASTNTLGILGEGIRILPYNIGGIMTKKCSKCKIKKDLSLFHKKKSVPDGLQYVCKSCHLENNRIWRAKNPKKYKLICTKNNDNPEKRYKKKIKQRTERKELADTYIRNLITLKNDLKPKDIPDEFVKAYRLNLKLKRILKLTPKLTSST